MFITKKKLEKIIQEEKNKTSDEIYASQRRNELEDKVYTLESDSRELKYQIESLRRRLDNLDHEDDNSKSVR